MTRETKIQWPAADDPDLQASRLRATHDRAKWGHLGVEPARVVLGRLADKYGKKNAPEGAQGGLHGEN